MNLKKKQLRGLSTSWLEHKVEGSQGILVFLHGFPDTARCWSEQFSHFTNGKYTLVAPFSRGVAPSARSSNVRRYGTHAFCLDLNAILEEVDPTKKQPLWFIGHDLGVVYAWEACRFFNKRSAGLIVINGVNIRQVLFRMKKPSQLMKSWYMFAMQIPKIPELLIERLGPRLLDISYKLAGLPAACRPPKAEALAGLQGGFAQYRAFLRESADHILKKNRNRLQCPVLVIWGKDDGVLLPPTMDELEHDAAKPIVRMVEAAHWPHRECPETVNSLIDSFLKHEDKL